MGSRCARGASTPKTPCIYLTIRGQVLARAVYMGDAKQGPCQHSNRSRCQYQLRGAHGAIVLHGVVLPAPTKVVPVIAVIMGCNSFVRTAHDNAGGTITTPPASGVYQ